MRSSFLIYGVTGCVGEVIARSAVEQGLRPVLAGRDGERVAALAAELGLPYRVIELADTAALTAALREVVVVLHCAGPFELTYKPMMQACLRAGTHYLDITGEIPVYEALVACDAAAKTHGLMIMPGVGFDVVPTDCLAAHLKRRLPSATRLTLAFHSDGPAALPPGTVRTGARLARLPTLVRRGGRLEAAPPAERDKTIDFGAGPQRCRRLSWGDVYLAYFSTGIGNIQTYMGVTPAMAFQLSLLDLLRPLMHRPGLQALLRRAVKGGSTPEERARTRTHIWGEVCDERGRRAAARLHGPEAGVVWTTATALAVVKKVLAGVVSPGFQTPSRAYGSDFVLNSHPDVRREDLV